MINAIHSFLVSLLPFFTLMLFLNLALLLIPKVMIYLFIFLTQFLFLVLIYSHLFPRPFYGSGLSWKLDGKVLPQNTDPEPTAFFLFVCF